MGYFRGASRLTEDKIDGPGMLFGQMPNGDRVTVLRMKKVRGEPRLWRIFIDLDLSAAEEVICRALNLQRMEAEAQTNDPR